MATILVIPGPNAEIMPLALGLALEGNQIWCLRTHPFPEVILENHIPEVNMTHQGVLRDVGLDFVIVDSSLTTLDGRPYAERKLQEIQDEVRNLRTALYAQELPPETLADVVIPRNSPDREMLRANISAGPVTLPEMQRRGDRHYLFITQREDHLESVLDMSAKRARFSLTSGKEIK